MALFTKLNEEFLSYIASRHEGGWVYNSPANKVKSEFCEWVKQTYPDKTENVDSLWAKFSYEYSAMLTM